MTSGLPKRAFERYELLRPLGEGGAGTVYLALDRETGAQVALKTLTHMTPLSVLRFKREFRALADIRHRNLVKLYELEHADSGWFLSMEFVDGAAFLSDLHERGDNSPSANRAREQAILERFRQLAQGVQAIHQAGMLHCDLKPSNVMLEHTGRVVVLDFGLVRELSPSAQDLSSDGMTAGTPAYMPPEQARGDELTAASDWYAFGVLEAALTDCVRMRASVCEHVCGPSGSGKTALVQSFLAASAQLAPDLIVLRSRCYERETIAFKSIDGLVDALVTFLVTLDEVQLAHVMGRDLVALTALFPAFKQIPTVQRLLEPRNTVQRGDSLQLRRRAEDAFRSLLCSLAQSQPLVIWIDDLQWGDLDSAQMLQDWLTRPFEAPALLIMSYRSDETATSACLSALVSPAARSTQLVRQHEIQLRPLSDSDVHALCSRRFGAAQSLGPIIAKIVRDAQGNPFLSTQLTALARAKLSRGDNDLRSLSVEDLVLHTSALLSEPALQLLRVLAVAGRPLPPRVALQASNVTRDQRARVHELQTLRLVRTRYASGEKLLEVYHDRVRTSIDGALSEVERKQIYEALLQLLLLNSSSHDPAWLHQLALGAGQYPLAYHHGLLAADSANANLAFERAAELYECCLRYAANDVERSQLLVKLASAHVRCRRGKQAAGAYLAASKLAPGQERIELLRLAASHLLRSGYFEEGERVVQQVLAGLDISVPSSELGQYAAIGWERTRIAVLQRTVKPRADVALPPDVVRLGMTYAMLALEKKHAPPTLHKPAELRLQVRAAAIRGERARASELLELSRLAHAELGAADDMERDRYALGLLLGGEQGSQLTSQATAALRGLGVREPTEEIRGFFPELFR